MIKFLSARIVLINIGSAIDKIKPLATSAALTENAVPIRPTIGPPIICPKASICAVVEITVARTTSQRCTIVRVGPRALGD